MSSLTQRRGTLSDLDYKSFNSCPIYLCRSMLIIIVCLVFVPTNVHASGFFELQFLGGVRNSTTVHVCLKEFWNSQVNLNRCTFGQKTSIFNELGTPARSAVKIPFSFRWIGSFSFTVQLSENSKNGQDRFVVEDEFAVPNLDWKMRTFHAKDGRIVAIRFRIACDNNYYGEDCATLCRPRNDTYGHYTCDKQGKPICLDGWKEQNCSIPKCRSGCNEMHGYCNEPGECVCRRGWTGPTCDECEKYPGCQHGYCLSPFQCICHRNWGGILCDQDLNYCGTHEPCLNNGQCENIAPNNYRCACKPGFSGANCQTVEDACATSPCLSGGTCTTRNNGTDFHCYCRPGFSGPRCERDLNECSPQPCLNGGTCHDLENGFRCTCPSGWTGDKCEQDVDECSALVTPCIRSSACINLNGSYQCVCEKGFEGQFCEIEIDDCSRNDVQCSNGGFCIDLLDDYRCACATGFTGSSCEKIDDSVCESLPAHVWRLNGTDNQCEKGEKICVCQDGGKVICACQDELADNFYDPNNEEYSCADVSSSSLKTTAKKLTMEKDGKMMDLGKKEIRVVFDSNVTQSSCLALFTIYTLITGETEHFCCRIDTPTELLINVHDNNPLSQYIQRTIFPHILHVIVNNKQYERIDWTWIDYTIVVFVSLLLVALYALFRKRKRQQKLKHDSQNVVIHCIQNNLNLRGDSQFRPITPPEPLKKNIAGNSGTLLKYSPPQSVLPIGNCAQYSPEILKKCSQNSSLYQLSSPNAKHYQSQYHVNNYESSIKQLSNEKHQNQHSYHEYEYQKNHKKQQQQQQQQKANNHHHHYKSNHSLHHSSTTSSSSSSQSNSLSSTSYHTSYPYDHKKLDY